MEPAYNTTKYFAPTYDEVINLTGVKHMKELDKDGLLESLDFDSLDRCEPCLLGKMTKTPFPGFVDQETDLL
jgi:hypothetical protein